MKTLLIDMDSVLCDLMTDWHKRYNEDYNDNLSVDRLLCWDSAKYVKKECGNKIYDYLDEEGLFLNLKPLPNAIEVLQRLHKHYNIFIVTTSHTYAYTEKELWVRNHIPFIGAKKIIFTHQKNQVKGDLLFDDAPHNLEAFKDAGRQVVAMDYPYNRNINVPRVKSWLEFEDFLQTKAFY
ncbi:5' nucleotidase, NT5C type [Priestia endophytica]|uniref:5'(3')-deoxyribonucleotidase n=1 Tax=Priestia endophytica TaxID=135735 RepID=A0AAX1Q363_9BACI|nr:5'(3')-deoxyribonucleotidase [Priestia endophytica]RAS71882.1 5'(3')-deoxyribonucleotidase [Priestia endophytica]RAS92007.1 5'(3')-deoxyribonucleotidase [Priestia endophytica]